MSGPLCWLGFSCARTAATAPGSPRAKPSSWTRHPRHAPDL